MRGSAADRSILTAGQLDPVGEAMSVAPVVLFAYNRPQHLRRTIEALQLDPWAERTELIVHADGARDPRAQPGVEAVRRYLRGVDGFRRIEIHERPDNLGLARSVIDGVSRVLRSHPALIVLEDDLIVSPRFLQVMNALLERYADEPRVFSVTGYSFPTASVRPPRGYPFSVYFSPRISSWGWGTWRDRWESVDWEVRDYASFAVDPHQRRQLARWGDDLGEMLDAQMRGEIDSWAIRFSYAAHCQSRLSAWPIRSLVDNIGLDGSGMHCTPDPRLVQQIDPAWPSELRLPANVELDPRFVRQVRLHFGQDLLSRARRRLRAALGRFTPRGAV